MAKKLTAAQRREKRQRKKDKEKAKEMAEYGKTHPEEYAAWLKKQEAKKRKKQREIAAAMPMEKKVKANRHAARKGKPLPYPVTYKIKSGYVYATFHGFEVKFKHKYKNHILTNDEIWILLDAIVPIEVPVSDEPDAEKVNVIFGPDEWEGIPYWGIHPIKNYKLKEGYKRYNDIIDFNDQQKNGLNYGKKHAEYGVEYTPTEPVLQPKKKKEYDPSLAIYKPCNLEDRHKAELEAMEQLEETKLESEVPRPDDILPWE